MDKVCVRVFIDVCVHIARVFGSTIYFFQKKTLSLIKWLEKFKRCVELLVNNEASAGLLSIYFLHVS